MCLPSTLFFVYTGVFFHTKRILTSKAIPQLLDQTQKVIPQIQIRLFLIKVFLSLNKIFFGLSGFPNVQSFIWVTRYLVLDFGWIILHTPFSLTELGSRRIQLPSFTLIHNGANILSRDKRNGSSILCFHSWTTGSFHHLRLSLWKLLKSC